ncbi:MAG: Serine phosphatase RsbU, regulator of sigma subunit [Candidatus Acidoferrum typicum]|nr:Serine phosphatase RsbU, regulator of sigma subunit [Candidatus Acidoferrum typicum]
MSSSLPPRPTSPHLRLHCVNVFVRDQDRSLHFFVDQLGFNIAYDTRVQSGERWVGVSPPDGAAILSLIAPKPDSEQYKLIGRATQIVFVAEDVTTKFQEWSRRGVRFQTPPRLKRIRYQSQPEQTAAAAGANQSPVSSAAVRAGMLLGEETPVWGGIVARFRDIDGNSFSLVSFDELTHAMEAQRRAVAAKQEAERRAAHELEIAKNVQSRLFPQTLPPLATLDYAGVCIQARQVGGDYYDFLDLGQNRLGFVIADISGKGIAAALLMANLQANLRSLCAITRHEPDHLLRSVNQLFCENTTDGAYATLFFAEYDDATRVLRFANCGHLPALLLRTDNSVARLDATATVLGIFKKWDCEVGECHLAPGDIFALYTDGITESFNRDGEEFGESRLLDSLRLHRALSPRAALASIVDEVLHFNPQEQHDDITLILARCHE